MSGDPLWERQSANGPYYELEWRTIASLLLLVCAGQWLSNNFFRWISQSTRSWQFVRAHQLTTGLTVIFVTALMGWGWINTARYRGQIVARVDLANGHARQLGFGLPVPWQPDYVRLLQERYGIEFRAVAGCVVSKPLIDYVEGYNEVSMAAAIQRCGRDVFAECNNDAHKLSAIHRATE